MKKIAVFLVLMLAGLMIAGCGVQVKQEGNKIFTDADKDIVYKYAVSALEKEKYNITEKDKETGVINSKPEKDNPTFAEIEDDPRVNIMIKERPEENDIEVTIEALISGDVDEKQSILVARRAVDQLIAELNKYGMFTVTQEGIYDLPSVNSESFLNYLANALESKGYSVSKTDTSVEAREAVADSEYNEPLVAKVDAVGEGDQVNIAIIASIEGNYDRIGSEQKARSAVSEITALVEAYPVVDKSVQHSFYYLTTKSGLAYSKLALDSLGYIIDNEDEEAMTLTTQKDGLMLTISVSDIGDNTTAVNVNVKGEGGDSKAVLEASADSTLTDINDELAMYQIAQSDTKMFASTPLDNAYRYARNALVGTGYTVVKASKESFIVVGSKSSGMIKTACVINSMGTDGIAIEVTAYVNGKKLSQADASTRASSEVAKIIKYLGRYDKMDTK